MSLVDISNVVLLFSNPLYFGLGTEPSTVLKNITALSSSMAYSSRISDNLVTLSSRSISSSQTIQGLLYVPDLDRGDPCQETLRNYIPRSVVRQANLPPTTFNLIALAPWINAECTQSFLTAARVDPLRAFIFYQPISNNTDSGTTPPESSPIWDLQGGDTWRTQNRFPVFAVPGRVGVDMMHQLSLYSGNITTVPNGANIAALYDPNEEDYVRIWTQLSVSANNSLTGMWILVPVIFGVLVGVIVLISILQHCVQRQRRRALRRRIKAGDVNLEALGIKRLMVPLGHIQTFPLFTYSYSPHALSPPASPTSLGSADGDRIARLSFQTLSDTLVASAAPTVPGAAFSADGKEMALSPGQTPPASAPDLGLSYQPTCLICLEPYVDRQTVIRELPCGHIFHPECIDEFLSLSSLCPLCKTSMLPKGYCPRVTNAMVRREIATRRIRGLVIFNSDTGPPGTSKTKRRHPPIPDHQRTTAVELELQGQQLARHQSNIARQRMRELAGPDPDSESNGSVGPRPSLWRRVGHSVFPGFR